MKQVLHEGVLHERKDPFVRYLFCFLETAFDLIRPETAIKLVSEYEHIHMTSKIAKKVVPWQCHRSISFRFSLINEEKVSEM